MRSASFLLLAAAAALAFGPRTPVWAADNTPPPGYIALFNGKDLTNWQGLVEMPQQLKLKDNPDQLAAAIKSANERYLPHWTVTPEGVLRYDGKGQSLQTVKWYKDFDLYVDWKIEKGGDSGIYLRGAPQVQIWENKVGSGGLYNNQKNPSNPLKVADKPAGEWNTFHIIMKGDKVTVWLNDVLVVDNVTMENYWNRNIPIYEAGPIELQHHGSVLEFKNIYLKELK